MAHKHTNNKGALKPKPACWGRDSCTAKGAEKFDPGLNFSQAYKGKNHKPKVGSLLAWLHMIGSFKCQQGDYKLTG